jgi:RNA polymerase-binding transcription factor DksA
MSDPLDPTDAADTPAGEIPAAGPGAAIEPVDQSVDQSVVEPVDQPVVESVAQPAAEPRLDLDGIERDLADVELALARLDSGEYWTDEVTGAAIPDEHLAEHPTARRLADR